MRDPFVRSKVANDLASADLTVSVDLENTSDKPVSGTVVVVLDGVATTIPVSVAAGATQKAALDEKEHPGLHLTKPRLWWPVGYGKPELYSLQVRVNVDNSVSTTHTIRFGVREVTSELTADGYRLHRINGHPILIRGAGWARNLFFMETPKREEQEIRLVRDMGLNAVHFEGKIGSDHLLDLADENGIFVIPGFCCCDYWEQWSRWRRRHQGPGGGVSAGPLRPAAQSSEYAYVLVCQRQVRPAGDQAQYLKVIEQTQWPNPTCASAGSYTTVVGPTGVKMMGPYDYEPPVYWYGDRDGAAFGFATEIGTGKTLPSVEDMGRMLGDNHLWPPDNAWTQHSQGGEYTPFTYFDEALQGTTARPPMSTITSARPSSSPTTTNAPCSRPTAATSTSRPGSSSGC